MSLIDQTYFTGNISIANLTQPDVQAGLQLYINQYENPMMQAALGYDFWNAFMTGLQQPIIDARWVALLTGTAFTPATLWPAFGWGLPWSNAYFNWYSPWTPLRKIYWVGFAQPTTTIVTNTPQGPLLTLTVDSGANNPVSGTNVFSLNLLAGSQYYVERQGFGTLTASQVSISNNGQTITLLGGPKFNTGEVYIIHFTSVMNIGSSSGYYQSPIAGYVYSWYMRDQITQNTGTGVVKTNTENASGSSAVPKINDAFNQTSKDIFTLWLYLEANTSLYPEYDRLQIDYYYFQPENRFGI